MSRPHRRLLAGLALGLSVRLLAENAPLPTERKVSPHVANLLASATPFAAPPPVAVAPRESPPPAAPLAPANGIVRLPAYLVRERKPAALPQPEDVLTERGLTPMAMQRFLGDEQGLDRALSMLTPVHLWRQIPILGRFPFAGFETNEQRARRLYADARNAERWEYLLSPEFRPSPPAALRP